MGRANYSLKKRKLHNLLSKVTYEEFLRMIWAVDALQSGRADLAKKYLRFPREAADESIVSQYKVHPWELETLIGEFFSCAPFVPKNGWNSTVDCSLYKSAATFINLLRSVEDAEVSFSLSAKDVLLEVHRIGHRQFKWQSGYFNMPQVGRYYFLYGNETCSQYFFEKYGVKLDDFMLVGFALFSGFLGFPFLEKKISLKEFGLSNVDVDKSLKLLCVSRRETQNLVFNIRKRSRLISGRLTMAYQPSPLRVCPVVVSGEHLVCPLPDLIIYRITAGIYYDLMGGGAKIINDANERFEEYIFRYLTEMYGSYAICRSYSYLFNRNTIDSPDVLISIDSKVRVVIECKATKLSFPAQFSERPTEDAKHAYDQISKGVFQLWRYFSHLKDGVAERQVHDDGVIGVVLTLDPWLVASPELQDKVLAKARMLADEKGGVPIESRPAIVFCDIVDVENVSASFSDSQFLEILSKSITNDFRGWSLKNIGSKIFGEQGNRKKYPFSLEEIAPWWRKIKDLSDKQQG